jgi:hypothetical protein
MIRFSLLKAIDVAWDTLNPNLRHFEKMIEKKKEGLKVL